MSIGERILAVLLEPVTERLESLMATAAELQQQVTDTKNSMLAAIGRVEEDVENLKDNQGIDPAQLDPISRGLSDMKSALDALDPDPSNPPPQPTP